MDLLCSCHSETSSFFICKYTMVKTSPILLSSWISSYISGRKKTRWLWSHKIKKTSFFKYVIILFRHFHSNAYFCIYPLLDSFNSIVGNYSHFLMLLVWFSDILSVCFIVLNGSHTAFLYKLSCGQWELWELRKNVLGFKQHPKIYTWAP